MDLQQQSKIINLYNQYQELDKNIIKANFKNHMDNNRIKPAELADRTGTPIQTVYKLRKPSNNYKPDFITAMIFCSALNIPITDVMQKVSISDMDITEPKNTKWDAEAKQQFVADYSNMDITALCKKYNITARTAQEYNRHFSNDLESV